MLFFILSMIAAASDDNLYTVNVDLQPMIYRDVAVSCTLSQALSYVVDSVTVSGAPSSIISSSVNNESDKTKITWNFGEVNNTGNQDILIQFKVLVADISSNQDGNVISPGVVSLSWIDSEGITHTSSSETHSVKIIEPALSISKHCDLTTAMSGDTVTCTINIFHSSNSHADAFDASLTESIPAGLTYVPGSMEIASGPAGDKDESKAGELTWHFEGIDQSWSEDNNIILSYKATVDKRAKTGSSLIAASGLTWSSAPADSSERRSYSEAAQSTLTITSRPPAFNLTLADYPSTVSPGGTLTYTISYKNRGGDATGSVIQASYDLNTVFLSADPAPDAGTTDQWTPGEGGLLVANASGSIKITLQVNSSLTDGTILAGRAILSCSQGTTAQDSVFTKVLASTPSLLIEKTASDTVIRPGGSLDYEISYKNDGSEDATNVTISDVVDSNLLFDPANSNPKPSQVSQEDDGIHLFWNASALASEKLASGQSGSITLQVSLPSVPEHPAYDWVYNNYKIDCDESPGKFKTLQTAVIHSLYIRKSVEETAYGTGELVNYTLCYGNDLAVDLDHTVIIDVLPDTKFMEYEFADPEPTSVQGNVITWDIGDLPAKARGTIYLYAYTVYNRSTINYYSSGSVSGQGFVNFDQRLDTAEEPKRLTNYANITARLVADQNIIEHDSSSASFIFSEAFGTALSIIGHGSGTYSREEESHLSSRNKTIQSKTDLSEQYHSTSFSLPGGRSISYSSKWSETQNAKNRVTGATMSESYRYANRIDRESDVLLDKNGSILNSETSFEGTGHVGLQKLAGGDNSTHFDEQELASHDRNTPVYESQEDYVGSFHVLTHFDEYGSNADASRAVTGTGYAASDKKLGESQGSYESGAGNYSAEERVQTVSSYLEKNISLSSRPVSYSYTPDINLRLSQKWSEGIWTRSGNYYPGSSKVYGNGSGVSSEADSFIGERFSSLDYLNKSTVVRGLGSMKTEADFQGKAEFKVELNTSANDSMPEVAYYEEYNGKYNLQRNVAISGIARYNEPHIAVSKAGKAATTGGSSSMIDYVITVTNDGNRALGPVYVSDFFPPGAQYVYSSLRPSSQNASIAQWTLLSLGIGATTTIDLRLNMTQASDNTVNRVQADGSYDGNVVSAQNYSSLQFNWLTCCPPEIWADMTARSDSTDPSLIHYSIILKNRANYAMAVTIRDDLGSGLEFQNSSTVPDSYSPSQAVWNIIDLQPGETRTIDYQARALYTGSFVSQAHIEAHALDGSGEALADLAVRVDLGSFVQDFHSSDWYPPACFGLNYTQQIYGDASGDEWMPCEACGLVEPGSDSSIDSSCISCTGSSTGGGYDVP